MVAAQKNTKKRSAPSQSGPKPKKVHVEKPKSDKKRSRPITAPVVVEEAGSESEGDWEDDDDDSAEAIVDDEGHDGDAMEVDEPKQQDLRPKDPNGGLHASSTLFEMLIKLLRPSSGSRIT